KAVESNCVTCGGTHSYQNCPATSGNIYQDNINEYVSQAAGANYNHGNTGFHPQMVANQIRPPRFPPVQNNQNNFNRGNNFTQNRGGNFNQSAFNQSQLHRPQVNQASTYQAPILQTQNVSQTDFKRYVKANDTVLRNIQSQGQSTQTQCQNIQNQYQTVQNQLANLTDMMSKFMSSNMASSSGSGTLPGNIVTNPKEDLKGITTRSGVAYKGPIIPTPSKVVKQGTEATKDPPIAAPVRAPMPNLKPSIPYPSRRDDERRREQANEQIEKFYEIFKDMSFEISFTDALILMPKFTSTLKSLIGNKEKLSEMARTSMNEHCSVVILNKLPKKLGDPGKFLIPCEFPGMDECLALADLVASIKLMPLSVWKEFSLPELTPTCMTLELTDCSVSKPIGIAKDVKVKVAWDRFNDLLRACPHHGFSELHQLDTFYNALNVNDQDSLNSGTGGNFLDKIPSDCLKIIESKSKVRQSRAKAVVAKVNSSSSTPAISSDVAKLKDMVRALLLNKKNQSLAPATSPTPASVKAVESNCVTCGGTHSYQNCPATSGNVY
nr:hypothetical protein [Tanacetum cinerariifolium]